MTQFICTLDFGDYQINFLTWQATEKEARAIVKKRFPRATILSITTHKSNV
jgi:hypothetical protein